MRFIQLQRMLFVMLVTLIALPFPLRAQQQPPTTPPEKPKTEVAIKTTASSRSSDAEAKPADSRKNINPPKAPPLSPAARLTGAHTAFIKRTGGSDIPYTVISESMQGWGHLAVVDIPEKADLILEVESPEDTNGLNFGGSGKSSTPTSEPDRASSTWVTKQTTGGDVKLTVRDAKTGSALWRAAEQAKSSIHKTNRENSLVEAAERLFVKFHDRLEPPIPLAH
jgi:hypothetical protein